MAVAAAVGQLPSPLAHSQMPGGPTQLGAITLPTVLVAGLVDGLNPCAFALLLVFIASALALTEQRASAGHAQSRAIVLGPGAVYISGIFITYLALGAGLLGVASFLASTHFVSRFAALASIGLGLLLVKEAVLPELGSVLAMPSGLHATARRWLGRSSLPGLFGAGVLVGLCTVPCSGVVYLAVLALLATQATQLEGFAYLVLYNLAFIAPLVLILLVASSRPLLNRLGRWQLHHRGALKLAMGSTTVLLGLAILRVV
ncbi:MAG: cytochrome c biogenesis CcdA family protein [Chloroflexota bacterium]